MANRYAVTATGSRESRSLKVTIPAAVCRALDIRPGDTFWVDVEILETVVLKYLWTGRRSENGHRS